MATARSARRTAQLTIGGIMLAVLAWGLFHALGAYLGAEQLVPDLRRAAMVVGCSLAFLGGWLALLTFRPSDTGRRREE